jgi:hypothetical protein
MSYKVSVLIPSYNSELTLTRAVRSVFDGNSGLLIQPVIVDDASTDSGLQTVSDMYESRIFNINVYRNEKNLRIAGTLNEAGKHATGRYFIRLDTDHANTTDGGQTPIRPALSTRTTSISTTLPDTVTCFGAKCGTPDCAGVRWVRSAGA